MKTFYWHDYETFGLNQRIDRPAQFAGIRTDEDLNIIGEPDIWYCRPAEDYLPQPGACLVTRITPQTAQEHGLSEDEFARRIHERFNETGTVSVGYNSLKFDDEISRFLFWRNLYDTYGREWKN
ncbi:MAG TPA: exodeoxyribonuclease I, partial [Sutterella sp.]|nr:exodeoxyribonuclease I [Sutterella sp.]